MAENLLIVESPAKAKTINKYLGNTFHVLASFGHIRDLEPKNDAIDTEHDFTMRYAWIDRNVDKIKAILREAQRADTIYLATDPDREGEAISWHIYEILKEKGLTKGKRIARATFSEITPAAVKHAVDNPRELIMDLVDAQQARRALDFLVGFNLSPVLWRKVQRGLSAGRVQSPALRLIVERDEEIAAFDPKEYWSIEATSEAARIPFSAKAIRLDGKKLEQFTLTNEADATAARQRILRDAQGQLKVIDIASKERRRKPAPPFTTSTLQQEAARKLGLSTKRTMQAAQRLYEGVSLGGGDPIGLITYMRTDSVALSAEAVDEIRSTILKKYGNDYLPPQPISHVNKAKNAQEAHEAVRPSSVTRSPDQVGQYLESDERRLYELIWKRTMACQMTNALLNTVSMDLSASDAHTFRVSGTTVIFPGFLAAYEEGKDNKEDGDDDMGRKLPKLSVGDTVPLNEVLCEQHFTQPPPRFTEAALVKALEEYGIGRPSTYAAIIQTLINRKYVEMDGKAFIPTDVGRAVVHFLHDHFTQYVEYDFTAQMENDLDRVSNGELGWKKLLGSFWEPFITLIKEKGNSVSRLEATGGRVLGTDPVSGREVSARLSRFGPCIQIGTKDDADKPRYAQMKDGQSIKTITLEEALELFALPRTVGELDGEPLVVGAGKFGPFVRLNKTYASLSKEDDPYTVSYERAVEVFRARQEFLKNRIIKEFPNSKIQILNGQYGPYCQKDKLRASIPKGVDPNDLTIEEIEKLLEDQKNAPKKPFKKFKKR